MVALILRLLLAIIPSAVLTGYFSVQNTIIDFGPKMILAILPTFIWLFIFLLEDRKHPEPKWKLTEAFFVGVLSAVALGAVIYYLVFVFKPAHPELPEAIKDFFSTDQNSRSDLSIFFHAFIEEIFKFTAIFLVFRKSKSLDEPIDGMIYLITGAMGFAAVENVLLVLSATDAISLMGFRFFGAVLLHALMAALIGFYWMKRKTIIEGILIAAALHGLFNVFTLKFEGGIIYGTWLLLIVAFFILRDFAIIKRYESR